jgi:YkoY family integral membrane protein
VNQLSTPTGGFCSLEAETVQSISPLMQAADQWGEMLLLLPLLLVLEAVLSADNAIALAAISRRLHDPQRQRRALNLGLLLALVFRLALIAGARWVLQVPALQLLAAAYLLWICFSQLLTRSEGDPETANAAGHHGADPAVSLVSVVATLAFTDLAFSLDSVAAAVAVSDRLILVMLGGVLGVIALRFTAELFIRWLERYRHLETAGYAAVGLVGVRLMLRVLLPHLPVPEWSLLVAVVLLFAWGFSVRNPLEAEAGGADAG